jgi:hypothetical protein
VPTKSTVTGPTTFPVLRTGDRPSYSYYSQDCVDREGGVCPLARNRALVVPTKSTATGLTTFPVLRTGDRPSYSYYSQDCVDREGGVCPLCPLNTNHTLVVPTKSTVTGPTTFPVLRTGDRPSYSYYSQDCVDREGGVSPLCPLNTNHTLVVPTKSTVTGPTTFPVRTTGTTLLTYYLGLTAIYRAQIPAQMVTRYLNNSVDSGLSPSIGFSHHGATNEYPLSI